MRTVRIGQITRVELVRLLHHNNTAFSTDLVFGLVRLGIGWNWLNWSSLADLVWIRSVLGYFGMTGLGSIWLI